MLTREIQYDANEDTGSVSYKAEPDGFVRFVVLEQIHFQHGPVKENGYNGIQNEDVIELLLLRMKALNERQPCRENSLAITKLEEALLWLQRRTALRQTQGVEGTEAKHVS